jgi:hypothetical protein
MERGLNETKGAERFTEHGIHAKAVSGVETLEQPQALLAHTDPRTPDCVEPVRQCDRCASRALYNPIGFP